MSDFISTMLALGVLVSILLIGAGVNILFRHPDDRKRGWLMVAAGIVTLLNIILYATTPQL